jgi:hypothetical protein
MPTVELRDCTTCNYPKPLTAFALTTDKKHRRRVCHRCREGKPPAPHPGASANQTPAAPPVPAPPPKFWGRELPKARRYLVTSAQNATPVHGPFLETLKQAAGYLGAELVVIPLRYRNPTTRGETSKTLGCGARPGQPCDPGCRARDRDKAKPCGTDWWALEVEPYLFDGRAALHRHLTLVADVKSQPTATRPLSGFEAMTGAESCIIGHPKMEFVVVPVPSGRFPKILTTTGAVTERNYSDTRAGKLGEFHHFLGGLVVEIDSKADLFHIRQINADRATGEFTDLDRHYTPHGSAPAPRALGLVMGDTHVRVTDQAVDAATFGPGGMVETLDPQTLVFHDILDGDTVNPHDTDNPFMKEARRKAKLQDVEEEIRQVVEFVNARGAGRDVVIVDSNHQDFLARWITRTDWRSDLKNADFYLRTALATLRSAQMLLNGPSYADPFPVALRELGLAGNVRCLGPDESFTLADIECGLHGHRGPNGARGSLKNLSRMGAKTITGHSHTPGIEEGGYAVGTSTPRRLHYAHGPSSWLNTHCVVYANGKRALLTVVGGRWCAA